MPNYSLSEIDALAKKATRGAGYSWGIAEEVGKSVRWLSAYGFSGAEDLSKHLVLVADKHQAFIPHKKNISVEGSTLESLEFENKDLQLCSLYCGTLINDLGHNLKANQSLSFNNMMSPLLALSSAARIAELYNISVSFTTKQTTIVCNSNGIAIKDTPPLLSSFSIGHTADIICNYLEGDSKNTHFPSPQSRSITDEALVILERLAHKTYAPATEESRLRGAG